MDKDTSTSERPKTYDELQEEVAEQYQALFDFFAQEHGLTLLQGEMDDIVHAVEKHKANALRKASASEVRVDTIVRCTPNWNNVEDNPLADIEITKTEGHTSIYWQSDLIDVEFIAAVPTNNGWWIEQCIIQHETGLCSLENGFYEPAPWGIEDITHWMPLPGLK